MKRFIKLLIIAFMLFQAVLASDIRFIFLSDINIDSKNKESIANFQKTIKEINAYNDLDFVVIGGNNIAKTNIENLNCFTKLIKKINKKTYVLLGSSDVLSSSGIDKKYYMKRVKRALLFRHSSKTNYTFKKKNYRFIVMDGSKQYFQSSNGYYDKNELFFLDKTLSKYKNDNIIILQHFPILPSESQWKTTSKIEDYLAVLNKHNNVKVIVSGHYDTNLEKEAFGIYHILVKNYSSDCIYKIIEINFDDDFIGTYLVK